MFIEGVKRVGILGGSFNPPHLGHLQICKYLFGRRECDEIWIIPCFQHPFGKIMAPYEDRLTMCRFTFQEMAGRVWVTDVERRLGGVSHTIRTLHYLKLQHPNFKFALIIGSDVAGDKEEWKEFNRIKDIADIIEIPRGENSPIINISSTDIRSKIRAGEKYDNFVLTPVAVYIVTHGLYHE